MKNTILLLMPHTVLSRTDFNRIYGLIGSALIIGILNIACTRLQTGDPAETITIGELSEHVFYLASDSLQGRMPGTEGYKKAAGYAESSFLQSGLESVCTDISGNRTFFQQVVLDKYELDKSNTELIISRANTDYSFEMSDHFEIGHNGPLNQNNVTGQAVFVGYGIHKPAYGRDDYKGIELKDRWAVMILELPDSILFNYFSGIEASFQSVHSRVVSAYQSVAKGVILLCPDSFIRRMKNRDNSKYTLPEIGSPPFRFNFPAVYADSVLVKLLMQGRTLNPFNHKGEINSFEITGVEITLKKSYHTTKISSGNIVAVVHGTDPVLRNEFITAGAHLDHLGVVYNRVNNGADDNASGSAAILEIAEAVALSGPKRSVLFLLYTAEEMGLLGSWYLINNAPVPVDRIKFNINLDMIGRRDGIAEDLITLIDDRNNTGLKNLLNEVNSRTEMIVLDSVDYNNYHDRSDQYCFSLVGVPNILFSTGEHRDYHTPRDDAEDIDYDFLQQVSTLTYELIMELANDSESLY